SLADRTDHINDPHGHCSSGTFHFNALTVQHRCHVFKIIPFLSLTRRTAVDRGHIKKRAELLSLRLDADASLEDIPCFQIKTPDLGWGNIYVILSGKVILTAYETISVRKDLQDTVRLLAAAKLGSLHGTS